MAAKECSNSRGLGMLVVGRFISRSVRENRTTSVWSVRDKLSLPDLIDFLIHVLT